MKITLEEEVLYRPKTIKNNDLWNHLILVGKIYCPLPKIITD